MPDSFARLFGYGLRMTVTLTGDRSRTWLPAYLLHGMRLGEDEVLVQVDQERIREGGRVVPDQMASRHEWARDHLDPPSAWRAGDCLL